MIENNEPEARGFGGNRHCTVHLDKPLKIERILFAQVKNVPCLGMFAWNL